MARKPRAWEAPLLQAAALGIPLDQSLRWASDFEQAEGGSRRARKKLSEVQRLLDAGEPIAKLVEAKKLTPALAEAFERPGPWPFSDLAVHNTPRPPGNLAMARWASELYVQVGTLNAVVFAFFLLSRRDALQFAATAFGPIGGVELGLALALSASVLFMATCFGAMADARQGRLAALLSSGLTGLRRRDAWAVARSLALDLAAGQDLPGALRNASKRGPRAVSAVARRVEGGASLRDSLQPGGWGRHLIPYAARAAQNGQLAATMALAARTIQGDIDRRMERFVAVASPLGQLIVAAFVGGMLYLLYSWLSSLPAAIALPSNP